MGIAGWLCAVLLAGVASGAEGGLLFEPNRGQAGREVEYLARGSRGVAYFAAGSMEMGGVRLECVGTERGAAWEPVEASKESISYLVGRDERKWVRDLPRYARLLRRGVYPGIDLSWYGIGGHVEYDFVVQAGADPRRIRMRVAGGRLKIERDGSLSVVTAKGVLRQHKPRLVQDGREVAGGFRLLGSHEYGFTVGLYDRRRPLEIDPVVDMATYLGGEAEDRIVAMDTSGHYVAMTRSVDFPGAPAGRSGGYNILVKTTLDALQDAVYVIGGSGDEQITGAAFSGTNVAVVGYTDSRDLPTQLSIDGRANAVPAWQREFAGGPSDGFFLWIGRTVRTQGPPAALFLSYFGSPGEDRLTGVTWTSGPVFVGSTDSSGLPVAPGLIRGQTGAAGGFEGFVVQASLTVNSFVPTITVMTYLGGAGDDRPLGIAPGGPGLYVTGETTSPDFPMAAAGGTKQGESDAFVAVFQASSLDIRLTGSTLLGGSGKDRGTRVMAGRSGEVWVAGTTDSMDLAVKNAAQERYGGGASDLFVARLSADLTEVLSLSYFGGSGVEEVAAMAGDSWGVYVGGWTSSPDLPVVNAAQSGYGGGPDDALLLYFLGDGPLHAATYFGGSGSDRIHGLTLGAVYGTIFMSGETTSPDLPLRSASQKVLRGGSDGFLAQLSAPLISAPHAKGAKGFRSYATLRVGLLNGDAGTTVTVRSGDPASVLVAEDAVAPAAESAQVLPDAWQGIYPRAYQVVCLVEKGGAELTFTAPGYLPATARADCYQPQIQVTLSGTGMLPSSNARPVYSLWSGPITMTALLVARNPDKPNEYMTLTASGPESDGHVQIVNANAGTGQVMPEVLDFSQNTNQQFTFRPQGLGDTLLHFTSRSAGELGTQPMTIAAPITAPATTYPVAEGFQAPIKAVLYAGAGSPLDYTVTYTSSDPGRLLLSTDVTRPGTAQVKTKDGYIFAQALASSGVVEVAAALEGFPAVVMPVRLAAAELACDSCAAPLTVAVGTAGRVSARVVAAGYPDVLPTLYVAPATEPFRLSLESSDPAVAVPGAEQTFPVGQSLSVSVPFTAEAPGSTMLRLKDNRNLPRRAAMGEDVTLSVVTANLRIDDVGATQDMAAYGTVYRFSALGAANPVTLKVADPSVALLAVSPQDAGSGQITVNMSTGRSQYFVIGQGTKGRTTITATAAGYEPATATVTLGPAGIGWTAEGASARLYSTSSGTPALLTAYMLDPETLMPRAVQYLRTPVTVKLTSSAPEVASVTENVTLGGTGTSVSPALKSQGEALLSIAQPSGLSTPAGRQSFVMKVLAPLLSLYVPALSKDLQEPFQVNGVPASAPATITVTSSDSSRLMISSDPQAAGGSSASLESNSGKTFYAQALGGSGSVLVRAVAPGYEPAEANVNLRGIGVTISGDYLADSVQTTVGSAPTALHIWVVGMDPGFGAISLPSIQFRPGAGAPLIQIRNSNPAAGRLNREEVPATPGVVQDLTFTPLAPGETEISVVQPPGWTAPAKLKVTVRVSAPGS
jgi:hypothetical protein